MTLSGIVSQQMNGSDIHATTVVFLANASWNLAHFREPLIRDQLASGANVIAIAPFDGSEERLRGMGVRVIDVTIDRGGLSPLADVALWREYRRLFRQLRPDAIFAFTIKPNIWGGLAARALGLPIINNVSGLGTAFINRPLLKSLVSRLYKSAFRQSSCVFFQNEDDRTQFVDDGLVEASRTGLLPGSGVDLQRFAVSPPRNASPFRFVFVGRLLRDKGLVELAEAAQLLRQQGQSFTINAVGGEDADNRSAIAKAQLDAWSAQGFIKFLGPRDDVRGAIADSDCLVLPSYREGLPRAILEASAMARPVIATDVPGCRQAVDDGVTGLLCQSRNTADLARAMQQMMDLKPNARVAMGMNGRAKMEREFSQERVVELYSTALSRILKSREDGRLCR